MRICSVLTLFILSFLISAPSSHAFSTDVRAQKIFERVLQELTSAQARRPHRFKGMNDSFQYMATAAAQILIASDDLETIENVLDKSISSYKGNGYAHLMLAYIHDKRRSQESTFEHMKLFLEKSKSHTKFEEPFIHARSHARLRKGIYEYLVSQGVEMQDRKAVLYTKGPMQQLMYRLNHLQGFDNFLNVAFVAMMLGGGVFLLLGMLLGFNFASPVGRVLVPVYISIWVSYGVWLYDLAIGLPVQIDRILVIFGIIIGVFLLFLFFEYQEYNREQNLPLEEGYQRCPHCNEVIQKLLTECSSCRKPLSPGD